MLLTELEIYCSESNQLGSSQAAADEQRQNRPINGAARDLSSKREFALLLCCRWEDRSEAFALCCLCCVCVWWCERAADYLAAVAGTYASADMAREGAGSATCRGARG